MTYPKIDFTPFLVIIDRFGDKKIDRFGDKNRVNSRNFNVTIQKFSEKFDDQFSHVFKFPTCFLRVTVSLQCCSQGRTALQRAVHNSPHQL